MIKPSARWCVCIALSLLPGQALAADPTTAAQDAAGAVLEQFGSADGIRENASLPLTSDSAQLSTIDGSNSAAVQISNPSSNAFLSVSIQKAATGDLMPVRVSQDLNFNGVFEYAYQVPFPASGICANGIISCDAGTWDNCQGYTWSADAMARASLQSVPMNQMAGCYCINQSCGGNNNPEAMLKDLGGAVAGVVQQQKGGYTISRVELNASTISYYGQDSSGSPTGTVAQTAYFSDPGSISGDAYTEVANQAGDPDSYYSMLNTSIERRGFTTSLHSCSINRIVTLEQRSRVCPDGQPPDPISGRCIEFAGSGISAIYVFLIISRGIEISDSLIRLSFGLLGTGNWVDLRDGGISQVGSIFIEVGNGKIRFGDIRYDTGSWISLNSSGVSQSTYFGIEVSNGQLRFYRVGGKTGQWVRFLSESDAICSYEVMETLNDLCSFMANNADCSLQEETVDSVQTFRNFKSTGLAPLPSTRHLYASPSCNTTAPPYTQTVTRDLWQKERTYNCSSNTFDLSDAARRVDTITGSLEGNSMDQTTFDFTDARKNIDSGTWTTDDQSLEVNKIGLPPDCEFICKTRKPVQDTQASLTGVTTDYQNTPTRYDTLYHVCGPDNSCPAGQGEEIVKDCQCLDEFAEAASIMMVLDEAGRDMLCTGGGTNATGDCLGEIKIFDGKRSECLQNGWYTTFFDCCDASVDSFLFFREHCPDASLETVQAKQADRAHYIGTYCKKDVFLIGCIQEAEVYCLFNSQMGRIIHEQGRVQLQQFNPNGNWGSAGAPNCEGLTPEEFQMLDFSEIDLSEMFGDIAPLPAAQMQNDVQGAINDFQNKAQ